MVVTDVYHETSRKVRGETDTWDPKVGRVSDSLTVVKSSRQGGT